MSFLIAQLRIFVTEKAIKFVFTKVSQMFVRKSVRMFVLLAILLLYYHAYFFLFVTTQPTLYEQIGVSPKASEQTIRTQLKKLYRSNHPDKNDKSAADFVHFQEIGHVLDDPNLKWMYDRFNATAELTTKYK